MKFQINWRLKLYLKIVFSHVPYIYFLLSRLGVAKHGYMDSVEYSKGVFLRHFNQFQKFKKTNDESKVFLELGCGDSLANGVIGYFYGVHKTILIDNAKYENASFSFYQSLVEDLKQTFSVKVDFSSKEDLFKKTSSLYLHRGLESLKEVPSNSVDFIFSQAVLEHIFRDEFYPILSEFYRILKPGGVMSHVVDYKDHLSTSLNNLRFSSSFWESSIVRKSLVYTNRFRHQEVVSLMEKIHFDVCEQDLSKWENLPLDKSYFDNSFDSFSEEDLLINGASIVCRK